MINYYLCDILKTCAYLLMGILNIMQTQKFPLLHFNNNTSRSKCNICVLDEIFFCIKEKVDLRKFKREKK